MDPVEFERRMKTEMRNERPLAIAEIMSLAKPVWESMGITEEEYMHKCKEDRKKIQEEEEASTKSEYALQFPTGDDLQTEPDSAEGSV